MLYYYIGKYPIWIKDTPDIHSKNINVVKEGDYVNAKTIKDDWMELDKGFVYTLDNNGKILFTNQVKDVERRVNRLDMSVKERFVAYDGEERTEEDYSQDYPEEGQFNSYTYTPEDGIQRTVTTGKLSSSNNDEYNKMVVYNDSNGRSINDTYRYTSSGTILSETHKRYDERGNEVNTIKDGSGTVTETKETMANGQVITKRTQTDSGGNVIRTTRLDENGKPAKPMDDDAAMAAIGDYYGNGGNAIGHTANTPNLNLSITDTFGIHGMPYQFMDNVDRRVMDGSKLGRIFADRVVTRMPLMVMSPGEPKFLAGWKEEDIKDFWQNLIASVGGGGTIDDVLSKQGRYYVFEERWDEYMKYVNPLCRHAAIFLGIGGEDLPGGGGSLGKADYSGWTNPDVSGHLNYRHSAAFYIHTETQVTDNMTNTTFRSSIADKINSTSEMAKEVQFLMGSAGAMTGSKTATAVGNLSKDAELNAANAQQFVEDNLGSSNFLSKIAGNLATVVQGGKLIFPEIWGDSQFSKSYNVTIKLRCPDPDPLSWFFTIWVPIAHILPYVLPKQSGPNGYIAPFLCRAFFKGLFTCQMGLVTGVNITRGSGAGDWTLDGLPCSVDISLDIKDLYSILSVTQEGSNELEILSNIGLLDYIANICGVNINEPDIGRMITTWFYIKTGTASRLSGQMLNTIDQWATNLIMGMWR